MGISGGERLCEKVMGLEWEASVVGWPGQDGSVVVEAVVITEGGGSIHCEQVVREIIHANGAISPGPNESSALLVLGIGGDVASVVTCGCVGIVATFNLSDELSESGSGFHGLGLNSG